LKNDHILYSVFSLCMDKGRFVYEVVQDFFGNTLTVEEIEYWICFNMIQSAHRFNIDYKVQSFEETKKLIDEANRKQKLEMAKWKSKKK